MLTKTDITAIRKADDICVHLSARNPQGLVRLIKRKPYHAKPFETDQEYVLDAPVTMETSHGQMALDSGTADCFAMAGIYHGQGAHVSSILKTLRVGDEVTFSFYPDAHTNGYVAKAGLHADVLYLKVYRKGKRHTFEVEHSISEPNSARMCRGVPNGESYERRAEERRQSA